MRISDWSSDVCSSDLQSLYDEATARFLKEVVAGNARGFVADKLAERDERHRRMGDSRYVVEPNLKEGKGGLRALHTLFWIGKFAYQTQSVPALVAQGLLTRAELLQFQKEIGRPSCQAGGGQYVVIS